MKNQHIDKLLRCIVSFLIGVCIGYIIEKIIQHNNRDLTVSCLLWGYTSLSVYIGIPIVYKGLTVIKDFILRAFEVFTFGLWFFIPISYTLIFTGWIFVFAFGLSLGAVIAIPTMIYCLFRGIKKSKRFV